MVDSNTGGRILAMVPAPRSSRRRQTCAPRRAIWRAWPPASGRTAMPRRRGGPSPQFPRRTGQLLGHQDRCDRAHGAQPSHGSCLLSVGVLVAAAVTGRPSLLRPSTLQRQVTSPSTPRTGQPSRRCAPRLRRERSPLRRNDRLAGAVGSRRLTSYGRGISGLAGIALPLLLIRQFGCPELVLLRRATTPAEVDPGSNGTHGGQSNAQIHFEVSRTKHTGMRRQKSKWDVVGDGVKREPFE